MEQFVPGEIWLTIPKLNILKPEQSAVKFCFPSKPMFIRVNIVPILETVTILWIPESEIQIMWQYSMTPSAEQGHWAMLLKSKKRFLILDLGNKTRGERKYEKP